MLVWFVCHDVLCVELCCPHVQGAMQQIRSKLVHVLRQCQELLKFGSGGGQREAFVTLCDLLMVFARQLRKEGHLASLVYTPDEQMQQAMQVSLQEEETTCRAKLSVRTVSLSQEYVVENVLCEEEEEEGEDEGEMEAQAERLNDRRVLLAGFLKLAIFSAIDMKMAAPIFGQYLKVCALRHALWHTLAMSVWLSVL